MKKINNFSEKSFLLAGLLVSPFSLIPIESIFTNTIHLFTLSSLSSLALFYILINYKKLRILFYQQITLKISIICFLIISIIHFLSFNNFNYSLFSLSIQWITIPIFSYLYHKNISKYLPVYIIIFWLFDIIISIKLNMINDVGFIGNKNWHASLLILGVLYGGFTLQLKIKKSKQSSNNLSKLVKFILYAVAFILALYSGYLFYLCESRAATISIVFIILFYYIHKYRFSLNKRTIPIILSTFLLLSIVLICSYKRTVVGHESKKAVTTLISNLNEDVRIPLWKGCIKLISDYPLLGVGTNHFENTYVLYRPADYFLKIYNSPRSNHPHNTLLYIGAVFGIPGLLFWSALWIYPLIYCLIIFQKLSSFKKIVTISYFCLFIGGLVDLTLFCWPTVYLAGIFLGLLWKETWKNKGKLAITRNTNIHQYPTVNYNTKIYRRKYYRKIDFIIYPIAILVLILTIKEVYNTYFSSLYLNIGERVSKAGRQELALNYYKKSISYKKNPNAIYNSGLISTYILNSPEHALLYFNMMSEIYLENYAHNNAFIALNLEKLGKLNTALKYLKKEVIIYPLSVGAWSRLAKVQRQLNMNSKADYSLKQAQSAIHQKKLPQNAMNLLIKYPEYDFHPEKIPRKILKKLNEKQTNINPKAQLINE